MSAKNIKQSQNNADTSAQDSVIEISTSVMEALAETQSRRAKRLRIFSDRLRNNSIAKKNHNDRISILLKVSEKLENASNDIRDPKLELDRFKSKRT